MKYSESTYLMKMRLADSLRETLLQKSFSKITVSDIVDRCAVNRKTFYYHFSGIHDLLFWMFSQEFQKKIHIDDTLTDYVTLSHSVMDYVEQNEAIFHNVFGTLGEEGVKRALYTDIEELQQRIISDYEHRYQVAFEDEFRGFLVKFLTDAIVGILMEWIRHRRNRNREQTIEYLRDIFSSAIPGLIERELHIKK